MSLAVIYSTLSGNTLVVAQRMHTIVQRTHPEAELHDLLNLQPEDLAKFSHIILGASTYDDTEINPFGVMFFTNCQLTQPKPNWSDTKFTLFALGDSTYPVFCEAIEFMEREIPLYGGQIVGTRLRIDSYTGGIDDASLEQWVTEQLAALGLT